jgi:hypothetical protein
MLRQKVMIKKVSDQHYELTCSLCGQTAVVVRVGTRDDWADKDGTEYLQYRGITHEPMPGLDAKHGERIFPWLEKGDLAAIHAYFKEIDVRMEEGIDAYCPECDAIYCWTHFNPYQEFDDGFYDCTWGTCPQGHRRILDD